MNRSDTDGDQASEDTKAPSSQGEIVPPARTPEEEVLRVSGLSEEDRDELVMIARSYAGPLPPPEVLRDYGLIDPAIREEILRRWGGEIDHRHRQDQARLELAGRLAARGQAIALILGVGGLIAAVVIGVYGGPVVGPPSAAAIVSILGAVFGGAYWVSASRNKPEDRQPHQDPPEGDSGPRAGQ